jgi:hypothetical protein
MRKIKELIPRRRRAQVIFNLLAQTARGVNNCLRVLLIHCMLFSQYLSFVWVVYTLCGTNNFGLPGFAIELFGDNLCMTFGLKRSRFLNFYYGFAKN